MTASDPADVVRDRAIVEALAATAPEGSRPDECALCYEPLRGHYESFDHHDPECPWRRTREATT